MDDTTTQENEFDVGDTTEDDNIHFDNKNISDNNELATMGAGSQVESHLSTFRSDYARGTKRKDDEIDSFYNELEPYFKELVQSISNKEQLFESIDAIEKQTFKNLGSKSSLKNHDSIGTTFLGEHINAPPRKESCHKFLHERFNN